MGKFIYIYCGLLEYLMDIWDILLQFGTFCVHLVLFVFIWYIFSGFGIMYKEKSGNLALKFSPFYEFTNHCRIARNYNFTAN
jgi:hypothetical protein